MIALLLLLACAGAPDEDTDVGDTAPMLVAEDLVPELTPDDIVARFATALRDDAWLPTDLYPWMDGLIRDLGSDPRPECRVKASDDPGWSFFAMPEGGCHGGRYDMDGVLLLTQQNQDDAGVHLLESVHLYSMYGEATDGSGEVTAGGRLFLRTTLDAGSMELNANHGGTFADPSVEGTLQDGVSGNVTITGTFHRDAREFEGTLDAAFSGASPIDLRGLEFQSGCPSPVGTAMLRDPSTAWWTVELRDDCSGCGPLQFGGDDYGEVCMGSLVRDMVSERLALFADEEAP